MASRIHSDFGNRYFPIHQKEWITPAILCCKANRQTSTGANARKQTICTFGVCGSSKWLWKRDRAHDWTRIARIFMFPSLLQEWNGCDKISFINKGNTLFEIHGRGRCCIVVLIELRFARSTNWRSKQCPFSKVFFPITLERHTVVLPTRHSKSTDEPPNLHPFHCCRRSRSRILANWAMWIDLPTGSHKSFLVPAALVNRTARLSYYFFPQMLLRH